MVNRGPFGAPARRAVLMVAAVAALVASMLVPAIASAQDSKRVLLYTGTTGFRHTDGINGGRPVVQTALETAGYTVDWEDCTNNGGGATNCDNANKNPRIFTDENLARYDAVVLLNSSAGPPGPLWSDAQKASIIKYVQNGGGIAGVHNATDMGTTAETWNWWDGNNANSVVGATMAGHATTSTTNIGQIQVADHNNLSTKDLPDTYGFGDEHYNFRRNVRGSHHVLATIDERTYAPGGNAMGQDHPITWCKRYDGDAVNDNTGTPKAYNDGRTWLTSMGHFGSSYTENGGNNNLVKQIVGGVRWVAGEGRKSDCSGTVWSSYTREVLVADANNPIGIDVAKDGKVYWSEIGNPISLTSTGYIKMHDPAKAAGNKSTVISIETRADHGNSEDGVLGMSLQPGFDLADPAKRNLFVYYSPRNAAWPMTGNAQVVGYNQISRFTLTEDGTAAVPGSERVILRVPKAKISGSPAGCATGCPSTNGPGHVGGAGLDFDSAGNLYLGVGDDVAPGGGGHNNYAPMDFRAVERWDARKTSQNSADLRGKILRITPKQGVIAPDAEPGVATTYDVPAGNLFPVGTAKARPEIYVMGFRQPFTLHTDPANPGIVGTGEYCHDNSANAANRSPAGTCEWNLINKAGNQGWPFCVGNNSTANTMFRWNYATAATTGEQYDCNLAQMPSDIRYAPAGQTPVEPTFDGLDTVPGPAQKATIWKKYSGAADGQSTADFGNLDAGGMQPMAGPIYRYPEGTATPGAFPRYYNGSWLINNRGSDNGFWKEVKMRQDNNEMLRVSDWLPYNGGVNPNGANSGLVIGTQFGPDGALYMSRFQVGCCRDGTGPTNQNQIVKISFNVQDECLTDANAPVASATVSGQAYPDRPNTYVNTATLKLAATDSGCAGVKNIEYRQQGSTDWLPYTTDVVFNEAKAYTVEYRATDRKDNVAAVKTTSFEVLQINDTTPPVTSADASGNKDQRGYVIGSASFAITATDNEVGASGVHLVEYRTNGGAWTTYTAPVAFNTAGTYTVDYRATDKVNNTSAVKSVTFRILSGAGCTQARSDEFNGTALGSQWTRHTRNGGSPASAFTLGSGQLHFPTADLELDAASATTSLGPVNFIGQDLAALGTNWQVETEFTVKYTGGWQNTGLIVWNGDNNFFRSSITHDLNGGHIYVEQSKDNPSSTEGARSQAGSNITIAPTKTDPITVRMRYTRTNGSNTVVPQYRIMAPAAIAMADYASFGGAANFLNLDPTQARRDAAGSRIGIITQSNFPGTAGTHAYAGVPGQVDVNYFRVTPDPIDCEAVAPATTATLDPAAPATGDTYDRAVKVNLSATDTGTNASGVENTEYRITTNGVAGEWTSKANTASENPFVSQVTVSSSGTHVVEFRSTDKAANTEETKSVTFKVNMPVCDRSDEFDGTEILPRWIRHTRNGGTPTTGPLAPTVSGGQLHLPTNDLEIDAAAATSVGPINFLGQDLPALGTNWTVETQFTAQYRGGWQNIGLVVWNGDNNFIRSTLSHSLSSSAIYVESSKDNPGTTEGTRATAGGNRNILATNTGPVTIKMRYMRVNGANTIQAHYQIVAPASAATTDWVAFPGQASFFDLNPSGGARRDATGSRIGLIAQDNWPAGGTFPSNGVPAIAHVDYFRISPDTCPVAADQTAPTTTATAAPTAPNGTAGWYTSDVNVTLAGNDGANGSGVDRIEYKVNGGAFATYTAPIALTTTGTHVIEYRSIDKNNNIEATKTTTVKVDKAAPTSTATLEPATTPSLGPVTLTLAATDQAAGSGVAKLEYQVNTASPFGALGAAAVASSELAYETYDPANKPKFTAPGVYSVDYRATDAAGNVETAKSVAFTITAPNNDHTAPVTTQTLDPAAPGAGKTYSGPVKVKFSALDQSPGGPAAKTVDVNAAGDRWAPAAVSLVSGDTVKWNFGPEEHFPHDVWLVSPGGNMANPTKESEIILPGGPSVTKTLSTVGAYTFICKVHSFYDSTEGAWSGMVGTATVTAPPAGEQPSGVDFTEYKLNDGAWTKATNAAGANPFASEVLVEAEGQHTVQFRSTDKAGNVETAKSVAFGIDIPDPGFPIIEAFADPATGQAPLQTRFSASGYDPDGGELSYKWEFADGTVLGRGVTRTYTKPGTYTAKVTATDDEGDKTSKEVTVTVTAPGVLPPTVDVSSDRTTGAGPLAVKFTATGTDPDGPSSQLLYKWEFGDGTAASFDPNATHVYNAPGEYTARVTVSDASGATASKSITITVTSSPVNVAPVFEDGPYAASLNDNPMEMTFSAGVKDPNGDTFTLEWDFDDSSAKKAGTPVDHTYTTPGTYTVKVTATDAKGAATTKTISVVASQKANVLPTVDVLADPVQGTAPLVVRFSSQVGDADGSVANLGYVWAFGDGSFSAEKNPVHTYTAAGVYTASLTVTDARGGKTTKTVQITVTAVAGSAPAAKAPDAAPAQASWFGVSEPVKTSVSGFAKSGLSVKVTATEAMSGSAKLLVSSKVAKALGLKSTTLATTKVSFTNAGSKSVKFKVSSKVKKALAKAKGSVKVTLSVSLKAQGEATKNSTRAVTLTRK